MFWTGVGVGREGRCLTYEAASLKDMSQKTLVEVGYQESAEVVEVCTRVHSSSGLVESMF
jgi:hypothetical protein